MTTREEVHKLVDALPESRLESVAEILASQREDDTGAEEAKPGDIIDDWGNLSAMRRASSVRKMRRLEEEDGAVVEK